MTTWLPEVTLKIVPEVLVNWAPGVWRVGIVELTIRNL
jgi:hypothetical protein